MNPYQDEMDNLIELLYHLYPDPKAIRQHYGNLDRFKAYKLLDSSLALYHCPMTDRAIQEARAIRSRALRIYLDSCVEPYWDPSGSLDKSLSDLTLGAIESMIYNHTFNLSSAVRDGFTLILRYRDLGFLTEEEALEEAREFGQKLLDL